MIVIFREGRVKKLLYQLFIIGQGRVELFFVLCVFSAYVLYPSVYAGSFSAFALPVYFIKKKKGVVIGFAVLLLYLLAAGTLLVTGEKESNGSKNLYSTTAGTLVVSQKLLPGDIVFGAYKMRKYAGEPEGRFARGYYISDVELRRISVPLLRSILHVRQSVSEKLFYSTGGELRLTQAVMLGDKQFLTQETKDKYLLTGLGHLLAISGLHVGLYAMVCYFIFGFLPRKLRLIPAGLMLLLLIPFTGFKIPVLRAGLLGFCIVVAKFVDFSTDVRKLLLFFAGIFILVSPSMIVSPSFLLSFSAVYGLLHLNDLKYPKFLTPVMVGIVATVFIIPAVSAAFGSFNISSIISTPFLVPVISAQVICFLLYLALPSLSLEPIILLEKVHLLFIDVFAEKLGFVFTMYKAEILWAAAMMFFLYACARLRMLWLSFVLLLIPYIPAHVEKGGYFPNMGRSKGFVVVDDKVHIFFKGHHGDFLYRFIPYLAELGVEAADRGTIDIYGSENIFIPVKVTSEDYGWICVNRLDEECKAVYHTKSNSYGCDDDRVHILYKNKCSTGKTYLLSDTGDLIIDNPSE